MNARVSAIIVGFTGGNRNRPKKSLDCVKLLSRSTKLLPINTQSEDVIELQLADTKEEMKQALEEQRCIHEAEIERLSRTHQIQIATLDSKLGEAEKQAVQLVRDKKALEATLSKDANEKVAVSHQKCYLRLDGSSD